MRWQLFGEHEDGSAEGLPEGATGPGQDSDAAFWTSPVGHAARARLRGDRFFQIELDDATLSEYAESTTRAHGRRARRTCDLLGQIEELGWHLEHVTWWRVEHQDDEPGRHSLRAEDGSDHVRGVYLFHAMPDDDEGPVPSHVARPPLA